MRRVLVPHMEDEDDQENEKEMREKMESEKYKVGENQTTHNTSAWM